MARELLSRDDMQTLLVLAVQYPRRFLAVSGRLTCWAPNFARLNCDRDYRGEDMHESGPHIRRSELRSSDRQPESAEEPGPGFVLEVRVKVALWVRSLPQIAQRSVGRLESRDFPADQEAIASETINCLAVGPAFGPANRPPTGTIESPVAGARFGIGQEVRVERMIRNAEDSLAQLIATPNSDHDQRLAGGSPQLRRWMEWLGPPSLGAHLITRQAVDANAIVDRR